MIHPSAIVSAEAKIHEEAHVGPFCVIHGEVEIGKGTRLLNHVTVGNDFGSVSIGSHNLIYPGAYVGACPQDLKYNNEKTELIIGDSNTFRECVTINSGTVTGGGKTLIGDHNLLMAYVHIAHDCVLRNHIVIANSTNLAGHVEIQDHVKIGGDCNVIQFARMGAHSYVAGSANVRKDILPFSIAKGSDDAVSVIVNKIGLERLGWESDRVDQIYKAMRYLIKTKLPLTERLVVLKKDFQVNADVKFLVDFIETAERGVAL